MSGRVQVFPVVGPALDRLQRTAEQMAKKEAREDLKLLGQSYIIALKNEAKKPDRCWECRFPSRRHAGDGMDAPLKKARI